MWTELFREHPSSVGETYFQHQRRAFWFAGRLLKAGFACSLHGLVPAFCVRTASDTVHQLEAEMGHRAHANTQHCSVNRTTDA